MQITDKFLKDLGQRRTKLGLSFKYSLTPDEVVLLYLLADTPYYDLRKDIKAQFYKMGLSAYNRVIKVKRPMYHYKAAHYANLPHVSPVLSVSPKDGKFYKEVIDPVTFKVDTYLATGICVKRFLKAVPQHVKGMLEHYREWAMLERRCTSEKEIILTDGYRFIE